MPEDNELQVVIGDQVVECGNIDDKMRLEPVGGILTDETTEGYGPDEINAMIETLARYNQPAALQRLKQLAARQS
jgi:hypothetical protein